MKAFIRSVWNLTDQHYSVFACFTWHRKHQIPLSILIAFYLRSYPQATEQPQVILRFLPFCFEWFDSHCKKVMTRLVLVQINLMAWYYFSAHALVWMPPCNLQHGLWFAHPLIMLLVLPMVSGEPWWWLSELISFSCVGCLLKAYPSRSWDFCYNGLTNFLEKWFV